MFVYREYVKGQKVNSLGGKKRGGYKPSIGVRMILISVGGLR